jgi:hypothetical protein
VPRSLNLASCWLDHLLTTSSGYSEADLALPLIAREVEAAPARAPDVAIASILRNQPARAKLERPGDENIAVQAVQWPACRACKPAARFLCGRVAGSVSWRRHVLLTRAA